MPVLPTECAWAREAASARIDGELSQVEALRLDQHLLACAGCFAHAAGLGSLAIALRGASLEQPAIRIFTPRRPRRRVVAVGAALVVAAGAASFGLGVVLGGSQARVPAAIAASDAPSARADAAEQSLLARFWSVALPPQGRMEAV